MVEISIQGKEYVLHEGVTILGRGVEADIIIDSSKVSRIHARFIVRGDTVEIEDLGSKNGTFVNGERITTKRAVSATDTIKIANIPCVLRAEAKKPSVPAEEKKMQAKERIKEQSREEQKQAGLLIAGAAVGVIVVLVVLIFAASGEKDTASPRLREARALLEEVRTYVEGISPADDAAANDGMKRKLSEYAARLEEIPPAFTKEAGEAAVLKSRIRELERMLADKNRELERLTKAAAAYTDVVSGLMDGTLSEEEALPKLEEIRNTYPNTPAAADAEKKASEIRRRKKEEELSLVKKTHREVMGLLREKRFKEAFGKAEAVLSRRFTYLGEEDILPLKEAKEAVEKKAGEFFLARSKPVLEDLKETGVETAAKKLREAYAPVETIPGVKPLYEKALAKIEEAKREEKRRLQKALRKEIEETDKLFAARMYTRALERYTTLLARVKEADRADLEKKKRRAELFSAAKKAVIRFVTEKGGVDLPAGGHVKSISDTQMHVVGEEGGVVNVKWHECSDANFAALLKLALKAYPDARSYTALACILLEMGDKNGAISCFSRAIQLSPEIRTRYPDVYRESLKKLQK